MERGDSKLNGPALESRDTFAHVITQWAHLIYGLEFWTRDSAGSSAHSSHRGNQPQYVLGYLQALIQPRDPAMRQYLPGPLVLGLHVLYILSKYDVGPSWSERVLGLMLTSIGNYSSRYLTVSYDAFEGFLSMSKHTRVNRILLICHPLSISGST